MTLIFSRLLEAVEYISCKISDSILKLMTVWRITGKIIRIPLWLITGWSKKRHKVCGTIILQPYITESCGFQQSVLKKFFT